MHAQASGAGCPPVINSLWLSGKLRLTAICPRRMLRNPRCRHLSFLTFVQVVAPAVLALASLVTASASWTSARNTRKALNAQEASFKRQEEQEQKRAQEESLKMLVQTAVTEALKGQRRS